jgi:cytochrome c oxidase subunit 3
LAGGLGLLAAGVLNLIWQTKYGFPLLVTGGTIALLAVSNWAHTLIREKNVLENLLVDETWMKNGMKLFLISEAAIFGAFFAHHYYARVHSPAWPPAGAPHLETRLPAIATLVLMLSSGTCQWAHNLLRKGKRVASQRGILLTMVLGILFLGAQGYEWGFLKAYDDFTLKNGAFGTSFFIMTGFHGLHVSIGIILLSIVYVRLRLGHFTAERHFSMIAASWYWHFVDIVWIFLFGTMYLV